MIQEKGCSSTIYLCAKDQAAHSSVSQRAVLINVRKFQFPLQKYKSPWQKWQILEVIYLAPVSVSLFVCPDTQRFQGELPSKEDFVHSICGCCCASKWCIFYVGNNCIFLQFVRNYSGISQWNTTSKTCSFLKGYFVKRTHFLLFHKFQNLNRSKFFRGHRPSVPFSSKILVWPTFSKKRALFVHKCLNLDKPGSGPDIMDFLCKWSFNWQDRWHRRTIIIIRR